MALEKLLRARHWWLKPIILAIQEAEIRRIMVQSQPRQIVPETLSISQKPITEKAWWSGSRCRPRVQTLVPRKKKKKRKAAVSKML
jgi:hypothetical protein